jgi:hypothetical protein
MEQGAAARFVLFDGIVRAGAAGGDLLNAACFPLPDEEVRRGADHQPVNLPSQGPVKIRPIEGEEDGSISTQDLRRIGSLGKVGKVPLS